MTLSAPQECALALVHTGGRILAPLAVLLAREHGFSPLSLLVQGGKNARFWGYARLHALLQRVPVVWTPITTYRRASR